MGLNDINIVEETFDEEENEYEYWILYIITLKQTMEQNFSNTFKNIKYRVTADLHSLRLAKTGFNYRIQWKRSIEFIIN